MDKRTIYYSSPSKSTFIVQDIEMLKREYNIFTNSLPWTKKWKIFYCWISQFWFLIRNIHKIDIYICSFAGYHSILPIIFAKLSKKPSFVILNGTESVGIHEISYGSLLRWPLRVFIYYTISCATELWPVSKYLIKGTSLFYKDVLIYGLSVTFPNLKLNYANIPNGINTSFWKVNRSIGDFEYLSFVTVVSGLSQFQLKGIDLIIESAQQLPHLSFTIVGIYKPVHILNLDNVKFITKVDRNALLDIYSKNNVYLQMSSFEGFGVSLAEAMSCGLIPIGSRVNAIPDIIGDAGLIVEKKEVLNFIEQIKLLENENSTVRYLRSVQAAQQIRSNYTIEKRFQMMNNQIQSHFFK